LQLARELLAHDAPSWLVEKVLDAACDEVLHAHLCGQMASRLLGVPVWPTPPEVARRPLPSLTQLAEESWLDGCVGEGAAAKRATRAAALSSDRGARAIQDRIQRDEHRHAELAWEVLRWTVERGARETRDAVHAIHAAEPQATELDVEPLEYYGRLRASEIDAIGEQHVRECTRRRNETL